ncbi:MAG TPA: hypothetical protein VF331_19400 [Polyangiales bacterium]
MRWFLGAFFVAAQLGLQSAPAHACKCAPPPATSDALHAAEAVFEGRVTAILEEPAPAGQPSSAWLVRLHTVRAWKGVETEDITVRTPKDSAACGYAFVSGESYLVYAAGPTAQLAVDSCGRTQLIAAADADLAVLGMGVVPVDPKRPDAGDHSSHVRDVIKPAVKPGTGGCASCSVGQRRRTSLADLACFALGLAVASRRLRRS